MLDRIIDFVQMNLNKRLINAQSLTARLPYITPYIESRAFFTDPLYLPTYYYLGKTLKPITLLSLSLGNGLSTSCFLLSCKTVRGVLAYQQKSEQKDFYSPNMARHNIRQVYRHDLFVHVGDVVDKSCASCLNNNKWDVVLYDTEMPYDEAMRHFRVSWKYMNDNGVLIIDRINYHKPSRRAYYDFCNECNRSDDKVIHSKYGIGLIQK